MMVTREAAFTAATHPSSVVKVMLIQGVAEKEKLKRPLGECDRLAE